MGNTRQKFIGLIEELLEQKIITPYDLKRYVTNLEDLTNPAFVKHEMEEWYKKMGLEHITGRKLSLSDCPFTQEELEEAYEKGETILCVPAGVKREELGKLFRLDTWALHDPLVTPATEEEDCWVRTSMSPTPEYMKCTGVDVSRRFEDENKLNFSIERYLVFIGRMRYLTGRTPDLEYWIWLPRGRYDRSGMLIAGFDRNANLNVHGWMPQFSASFLGARYGIPPKSK
ncbi:hypothetical protein [Acetivibrio mesophilus]|uniref:Uncharacterized protein n=1 Tax=Acetivibrio mesophilus TaxID=2487273 RepID=A0A4Q0I8C9_9FIRM|nr:hypothetical protein [Acetivibrio mesophilus]ODM26236.1 hypothetical protein A7W90_08365 [Clostridium sp. Bc-iso-3]RXE60711.1 hypothetical protein EFD62_01975 [Acetivibrio mesophilus]HHV28124.1 hypothetical protein [Clostridium sp.]